SSFLATPFHRSGARRDLRSFPTRRSSDLEGYLAALFIDVAYQNNGAGKELLNFEKRRRNKIRLKVYKENLSAVRFYEKNGFIIKEELTDEQTNKQEYLMEWTKN